MIEDGQGPKPTLHEAGVGAEDEEISPFDAAAYVFQIAGELSVMSKHKGLGRVADGLERVRNAAAQAMMDERRKVSEA